MSLSIALDNINTPPQNHGDWRVAHGAFLPGSQVTGRVILKLDKDDEVEAVSITFVGEIKTEIETGSNNNKHHHYYRCTMFSFGKELFNGGDYKLRATTYEWPFAFQFPEHVNPDASFSKEHVGFTIGPQLPPSTCRAAGSRLRGEISYKLEARIPKMFLDTKSEVYLNLTPPRLEALPHSMHVPKSQVESSHEQKFRYDEVGPRSLTTKESISDKFHSHTDTKILNFKVSVSAPTQIVVSKPYPLFITLTCESDEAILPDFTIISIEAHLKAYTAVRAPGTFSDYFEDTESPISLVYAPEGQNIKLPINKMIPLNGIFPKRIYAPPTFSTAAMYRTYRLTVHVKIRCLDNVYKSSCKWPAVTLLPPKMEEGVEEAAEMIRNGQFGASNNAALSIEENISRPGDAPGITEDVPPPSYKEAQNER